MLRRVRCRRSSLAGDLVRSLLASRMLRAGVRAAATCLVSLLMCGLILEAAVRVSPAVRYLLSPPWSRVKVPDQVMGYRMSPLYPGIDERGYRNPRRTSQADILAVGDSMTYGFGAPDTQSWPRQLADISGLTVYNGGIGGYGPCEYRAVVDELLDLHPHLTVLAVFVGNDVADAYRSVYVDHRCRDLASHEPSTIDAIDRADRVATLQQLARQFGEEIPVAERPSRFKSLALYGLVRAVKVDLAGATLNPFAAGKDDSFEQAALKPLRRALREPPVFRTVLMDPRRDALGVDVADPRLLEGLRILLTAVGQMKHTIEAMHAHFGVAIIHNKPFVLEELIRSADPDLFASYAGLNALEADATARLEAWLDEHGVPFVDTLNGMRALVRAGTMPYAPSDDNHPNGVGYRAIARAIWERTAAWLPSEP